MHVKAVVNQESTTMQVECSVQDTAGKPEFELRRPQMAAAVYFQSRGT